jgi:hypothetical protein
MARASEQFRQGDVTLWGVVALVCGALAVLSANLSAIVPADMLSGLHASRQGVSTMIQMRNRLANLEAEASRLREDNAALVTRFTMAEQSAVDMTRRVGALEVSIPRLLEEIGPTTAVDQTTSTSGIGSDPVTTEVEGGSIEVTQQPLPAAQSPSSDQPLPSLPDTAEASEPIEAAGPFAIALGDAVAEDQARAAWNDIANRVGPLLLGLEPRLTEAPEGGARQIVAGPFDTIEAATQSCTRFAQVGISCLPAPFLGDPLP